MSVVLEDELVTDNLDPAEVLVYGISIELPSTFKDSIPLYCMNEHVLISQRLVRSLVSSQPTNVG